MQDFMMVVSPPVYPVGSKERGEMETGWVKLYRKLLDDPIWQNSTPAQKTVLVTLLMMANHKEKKWEYNHRPYICKPGQMITSLESIKRKAGMNISYNKIRSALKRFEMLGFITNKSTNKNRLITICNWDIYQNPENPNHKQLHKQATSSSHADHKQTTTNNNVKNVKNEKNGRSAPSFSFKNSDVNDDGSNPQVSPQLHAGGRNHDRSQSTPRTGRGANQGDNDLRNNSRLQTKLQQLENRFARIYGGKWQAVVNE